MFSSVFTLLLALAAACSPWPSEHQVRSDLETVLYEGGDSALTPRVVTMGPGDGDQEHVYMHVKFDALVSRSSVAGGKCLLKHPARAGDTLRGGEAILLYQEDGTGTWRRTWSEVRCPSP